MLRVLHQACTLATCALRSSCTISVKQSGKTHFCAELGGKVTILEPSWFFWDSPWDFPERGRSTEAAFKFAMLNTIAESSPATSMRYTNLLATVIPMKERDRASYETLGAGKLFGTSIFFSGANGFTNASLKS